MARAETTALRHLCTLMEVGSVAGLSDAQLLDRFTSRQGDASELALAALIERHGPMVLRVCQAVLGHAQDAEDAFQATFLVLVRRAESVRKRDSLASWLHGVALRVAACGRAAQARRRKHELRAVAGVCESEEAPVADDLSAILHEELDRLPENFRAAIVLCYLEGLTHEQAAEQLGCPVGTVRSRLARGRDRLRRRLIDRGLAPATALAAVLSSQNASAGVPTILLDLAVRRAAYGKAAEAAIPETILTLMRGGLSAMIVSKLKLAAIGLVAIGTAFAGAGVLAQSGNTPFQPAPANHPALEPLPPTPAQEDPLRPALADQATVQPIPATAGQGVAGSDEVRTLLANQERRLRALEQKLGLLLGQQPQAAMARTEPAQPGTSLQLADEEAQKAAIWAQLTRDGFLGRYDAPDVIPEEMVANLWRHYIGRRAPETDLRGLMLVFGPGAPRMAPEVIARRLLAEGPILTSPLGTAIRQRTELVPLDTPAPERRPTNSSFLPAPRQ